MFDKKKPEPDLEIFVAFDSKVGHYRDPVFGINQFDVIRQLEILMNSPQDSQHQYVTHAEDFQLFKIGSYHRKTGLITSQPPEHIANFHEIKVAAQRKNGSQSSLVGMQPT